MTIREYPFGFFITENTAPLVEANNRPFIAKQISPDLTLFHQPELPVEVFGNRDCGVVLLGFGTSTQAAEDSTESFAKAAWSALSKGEDEFHAFLDYAVGRWAAIVFYNGELRLYNDTLAMQPIYYARDSFAVSSHLPLLIEHLDKAGQGRIELQKLGPHKLWDETEDPRIGAVPANFYYEIYGRHLTRFYPHRPVESDTEQYEHRLGESVELIRNSVNFWSALPFKLFVALTAGMDTRLCAAATMSTGVPFTFVTYGSISAPSDSDTNAGRSYKIDVQAARRIAHDFKADSIILPVEDARLNALSAEERETLSRNSLGKHALFFQNLYEKTLGVQPSICFVGTGFEGLRDYYVTTDRPFSPFEEFKKVVGGIAGYSETRRGRRLSDAEAEGLWNEFEMETVLTHNFPIGNLLYQELRGSRFQSEAINCQATAFLPINPIAIRRVLETAQLLPIYERKASTFHRDLISQTFPALLGYPVNGKPFQQIETQKLSFPPVFSRSGDNSDAVQATQHLPDKIQLGSAQLCAGGEKFFRSSFTSHAGSLHIGFVNGYAIGRPVTNVIHFVRVNGRDAWTLPLGERSDECYLVIDGLSPGDQVDFGIRSTRENGVAWSNVSLTRLTRWTEYPGTPHGEIRASSTR